jgi:hypothetical protein
MQPSVSTPNNSNWFVTGETESWTTSLSARLGEFFAERATQVDWVHRVSTYDWLLSFVGFPLAFWGASRLGNLAAAFLSHASARNLPPVVKHRNLCLRVLSLANCLSEFFSYARWVFPKIELQSQQPGTFGIAQSGPPSCWVSSLPHSGMASRH